MDFWKYVPKIHLGSRRNTAKKPVFEDPIRKHWPRIQHWQDEEREAIAKLEAGKKLGGFRAPLAVRAYFFDPSVAHVAAFMGNVEAGIGENPKIKHALHTVLYSLPLPADWSILSDAKERYAHCLMLAGRTTERDYAEACRGAGRLIEEAHLAVQGNESFARYFEASPRVILWQDMNPHEFSARQFLYDALGRKLNKEVDLGRG